MYKQHIRHGEGTYYYADGRFYRGVWDHGACIHRHIEDEDTIAKVDLLKQEYKQKMKDLRRAERQARKEKEKQQSTNTSQSSTST